MSPLTFEQAVAALSADLVPTVEVSRCEELEPGSAEAQEYLDRIAGEQSAAAANEDELAALPTPTLPDCGIPQVESVRAESITGFSHPSGGAPELPVAGGGIRRIEVFELESAQAAEQTYATMVAQEEAGTVDREIPREQHEDGTYTPRTVISGSSVAELDPPGWTAMVFGHDTASFKDDGTPASSAFSYGYLWAVRDAILVRMQVAGDDVGRAGPTAQEMAAEYLAVVEEQLG